MNCDMYEYLLFLVHVDKASPFPACPAPHTAAECTYSQAAAWWCSLSLNTDRVLADLLTCSKDNLILLLLAAGIGFQGGSLWQRVLLGWCACG
jgi:hypothetical protein